MASIFLSHSSADKEFVRELHNLLKGKGIKSWIDEAEIKIGDSLIGKISEGIELADYVAIILSPSSINSPWVQKELEMALTKEVETRVTSVLPILIENCEIPSYLRGKKYGDFRTTSKSIKGMNELLDLLESKNINKNKASSNSANNDGSGDVEYKRFLKVYDELTYTGPLGNSRLPKKVGKVLAETFCLEENFLKFKKFLDIFHELTYTGPLGNSRFSRSDAVEIALKRLSIKIPTELRLISY